MIFNSKKNFIYLLLAGFFITNAVTAELIGGKLIQIGPFIMSIGIIPWPIVFLTTDLINEYFGKDGVKRLSLITAGLVSYAFVILFFAIKAKAAEGISAVSDEAFKQVFGQSMWIIVGSVIAFLVSQFIDVFIFWLLRDKTGGKMIWLRSTGSTVVSQLFDSFIVLSIGIWLPNFDTISTSDFLNMAFTNYSFKLIIAVLLTPLIYVTHGLIDKYLGAEANQIIKQSATESLHHKVDN